MIGRSSVPHLYAHTVFEHNALQRVPILQPVKHTATAKQSALPQSVLPFADEPFAPGSEHELTVACSALIGSTAASVRPK